MPTRGGNPPISARRVELVHGGSGVPLRQACFEGCLLRKFLRPQQLQQPEEAVRIVFERRRAEEQHVAAEAGDRRDGAPAWFAGMSRRTTQALRFVNDEQVDARAQPPGRSAAGASISISSAITARRCTSKGLKSAPKSRATSASRCASSSVNTW